MTSITASRLTVTDILGRDQNSFGVVRLAMAFAVLVSHSFFFVNGRAESAPLVSLTGHSLGEHGVQVFFILSGLLIAQSIAKSGSLVDFALARTLRIVPGLSVCVLLTAFVLGPMVTTLSPSAYFSDPLLRAYVVKTLFLTTGSAPLPGVFNTVPAGGLVNMSLWTLKYEIACYAGVGLLGIVGALANRQIRTTSIALGVLMIALSMALPQSLGKFNNLENACYLLLYFCAGILAFVLRHKLVLSILPLAGLTVVAIVAHGTPLTELTCALALGYATLCFAAIDFGWLRRLTDTHDLSFGVYIYAAPIQQTIAQLHPEMDPVTLAATATVFTIAAAYLSWEWIEKPALTLRYFRTKLSTTRWRTKAQPKPKTEHGRSQPETSRPRRPDNSWKQGLTRRGFA